MDAREIVNRGLQARKEVRNAEAKAQAYQDSLAEEKDARLRERHDRKIQAAHWAEERDKLMGVILEQRRTIHRLEKRIEARDKQDREARQRLILAGGLKGLIVFTLLITARDLGWITPWLVHCLLVGTAAYMFYSVIALAMKKK